MLERQHRLTGSAGFAATIRRGRRAGTRTLVVHLLVPSGTATLGDPGSACATGCTAPQVGLVVGKAVGNAVARNRVKRRLRALARERIAALPADATVVLRALPAAAEADQAGLGADLDRALTRLGLGPGRVAADGNAGPVAVRSAQRMGEVSV